MSLYPPNPLFIVRLEEDGTNRTWYALDGQGVKHIIAAALGRTVTITATKVFIGGNGNDAEMTRTLEVFHYKTGAL